MMFALGEAEGGVRFLLIKTQPRATVSFSKKPWKVSILVDLVTMSYEIFLGCSWNITRRPLGPGWALPGCELPIACR